MHRTDPSRETHVVGGADRTVHTRQHDLNHADHVYIPGVYLPRNKQMMKFDMVCPVCRVLVPSYQCDVLTIRYGHFLPSVIFGLFLNAYRAGHRVGCDVVAETRKRSGGVNCVC